LSVLLDDCGIPGAVAEAGRTPIVVDFGIGPQCCDVDIARSEVAAHHPDSAHFLGSADPGEAVVAMGEAFARFVSTRGDIDAMLGIHATDGLIALAVISTTPSFSMRWCKIS
jgi:uncharacterized protein (UPF0261 family)